MTSQELLNLFQQQPEENWITGSYAEYNKCCAMGFMRKHCRADKNISVFVEEAKWIQASGEFLTDNTNIIIVNDKATEKYPQSTPKQRVIALVKDMIKAGY